MRENIVVDTRQLLAVADTLEQAASEGNDPAPSADAPSGAGASYEAICRAVTAVRGCFDATSAALQDTAQCYVEVEKDAARLIADGFKDLA